MDPCEENTLSAGDRLNELCAHLDALEERIKTDLPSLSDWYTRQFAELRAKSMVVRSVVLALQPQAHADLDGLDAERDRHWIALKAAVETYRSILKGDPREI